ncbi:MAG: PIN domain nuclease [Clostridiales Family XIII bacterium]|jgi:uncharacterized protein YacL|nr:PIN domain nuclease [Clostridiales Family XIII bacterium]
MLKNLIRGGITLIGLAAGYGVFVLLRFAAVELGLFARNSLSEIQWGIAAAVIAIIFGFIFFLLTPQLTRVSARISKGIEAELRQQSPASIVAGTVGLIVGLVIASLIRPIFPLIQNEYISISLTVVTYVVFIWLGVVIGARFLKEQIGNLTQLRLRAAGRPAKAGKQADMTPKIFDTSVIIDGRIADIMKTGFIEGNIVIPDFVLVELRHIADSSDGLKRNRGRRGLDILNKIQTEYGIDIYSTQDDKTLSEVPEVDVKLLKLAQIMHGKVVTNDFNLNKVAMIQGVSVLNINELANTLKPVVLPGEDMNVFLVKEGKERAQAVAYLDDGTMIVVEDGRGYIGRSVDVSVTSVLQTSAGRMIFTKVK